MKAACYSREKQPSLHLQGGKKHPRETQMSTLIYWTLSGTIFWKHKMKPSRCLMFDAMKRKVHSIHDKKTTIANTKRCNSIHARNQEISENKAEHNLGRPTVRHHHNGSPCYDKRYQSTKGIKSHTTKMYTSGEKHHAARVQEASKKKKHKMKKNRRWGEFKAHRA